MIKNFSKELELISDNNRITEKLMIFSLYNEFYNSILGASDDYFITHYAPFMEKTFKLFISELYLQDDISLNAIEFMQMYFDLLKKNRLSLMPQAKGNIEYFENNFKAFVNIMNYVQVIDKYSSIPFIIKADILVQFRGFINNMVCTIVKLYDIEFTKELRDNILEMLINTLDDMFLKYYNEPIHIFCPTFIKPDILTIKDGKVEFKQNRDEYKLKQDHIGSLKLILMTATEKYLIGILDKTFESDDTSKKERRIN